MTAGKLFNVPASVCWPVKCGSWYAYTPCRLFWQREAENQDGACLVLSAQRVMLVVTVTVTVRSPGKGRARGPSAASPTASGQGTRTPVLLHPQLSPPRWRQLNGAVSISWASYSTDVK